MGTSRVLHRDLQKPLPGQLTHYLRRTLDVTWIMEVVCWLVRGTMLSCCKGHPGLCPAQHSSDSDCYVLSSSLGVRAQLTTSPWFSSCLFCAEGTDDPVSWNCILYPAAVGLFSLKLFWFGFSPAGPSSMLNKWSIILFSSVTKFWKGPFDLTNHSGSLWCCLT